MACSSTVNGIAWFAVQARDANRKYRSWFLRKQTGKRRMNLIFTDRFGPALARYRRKDSRVSRSMDSRSVLLARVAGPDIRGRSMLRRTHI